MAERPDLEYDVPILERLCPPFEGSPEFSMPVEDSDNHYPSRLDQVDEPIRADNEFAKARQLRVPKPVPSIRRLSQGFRGIHGELCEAARIRFRVLRYELNR